MTERERAVGVAADWFDRNHEGWWERVEPDKLNMMQCDYCICGQVFKQDNWSSVGQRIARETNVSMIGVFSGFQELWLQEIENRRVAAERKELMLVGSGSH